MTCQARGPGASGRAWQGTSSGKKIDSVHEFCVTRPGLLHLYIAIMTASVSLPSPLCIPSPLPPLVRLHASKHPSAVHILLHSSQDTDVAG